ncbi:hypothetical protein [Glutamicibacter arilaitensis]|uniref:Uncharacterized protein n=1 Tax=Glutamicibacter arilaitensis TaxID=256701 RepID=A0A4Y8U1I2_9MICC|nr:hypothetical protein [Glutamicibacter arilaitensis]TFH57631.1 hypothetical protein EXY26_11905 [Glutamicibacter arilaitensis]
MRASKTNPAAVPAALKEQAAQLPFKAQSISVLVFTLDTHLPFCEIAEHLAEQFTELELTAQVGMAGPQRVKSVLEGKFTGVDVLVVVGDTSSESEDRLMELVEWLLANGRRDLAENLIYAVLGHEYQNHATSAFSRVVLPRSYYARTQQSGLKLPWAASARESWELANAVVDYAFGLGAE